MSPFWSRTFVDGAETKSERIPSGTPCESIWSARDETAHEQDERVKPDVCLRDRRRSPGPWRNPTKRKGCRDIAKGSSNIRDAANPAIQTQFATQFCRVKCVRGNMSIAHWWNKRAR
jgi:hypothetical protein